MTFQDVIRLPQKPVQARERDKEKDRVCVRERVSEFEIGGRERKRETGMSFLTFATKSLMKRIIWEMEKK